MPIADCERLADGLLTQPVNALSSLAFVLVGIGLIARTPAHKVDYRPRARALATALVLVGLGSVAFHGPGGTWADWVHDASITALLVLVIVVEFGDRPSWIARHELVVWLTTTAVLGGFEAIWQPLANGLNAVLAGVAILALVVFRWRTPTRRGVSAALGLVAAGAVIMVLSRTDGPWCDSTSLLQGHAVWHVLAAFGLGTYASSVSLGPSGGDSVSLTQR